MFDNAIAWAARTRKFRRAVIEAGSTGRTLADLRDELERDEAGLPASESGRLAELRLLPVLEAMPSIGGKVASRRLLASAGLADDVVLGDVDEAAWELLVGHVPSTVTP